MLEMPPTKLCSSLFRRVLPKVEKMCSAVLVLLLGLAHTGLGLPQTGSRYDSHRGLGKNSLTHVHTSCTYLLFPKLRGERIIWKEFGVFFLHPRDFFDFFFTKKTQSMTFVWTSNTTGQGPHEPRVFMDFLVLAHRRLRPVGPGGSEIRQDRGGDPKR